MPGWVTKDGKREYVETAEQLKQKLGEGYAVDSEITFDVGRGEQATARTTEEARILADRGAQVEGFGSKLQRSRKARLEREHGGIGGKIETGARAALSAGTFGLSDALLSDEGKEELREMREANPYSDLVGGLVGAVANPISRAVVAKKGIVTGGAIEGGLAGAGEAARDLILSEEPVTGERIVSSVGGNFLYGGAIGGGVGLFGKAAQKGFRKAAQRIEDSRLGTLAETDDLAKLDRKGLRAARQAEIENLEKARVARSAELPDELRAHRAATKADPDYERIWARLQNAKRDKVLAKRSARQRKGEIEPLLETDTLRLVEGRAVPGAQNENLSDLLSRWAKFQKKGKSYDWLVEKKAAGIKRGRVSPALTVIDEEAQLLEDLAKAAPDLAEPIERMAARNAKLSETVEGLASKNYTSDRLNNIEAARDALSSGSNKAGLIESGARSAALAGVTALTAPFAGVGSALLGGKAADIIGDLVAGRLAKAGSKASERSQQAIRSFLDAGSKATKAAPVIAAKTLSAAQFAPSKEDSGKDARSAYKAREKEIRSQTMLGPEGMEMTPKARQELGARLAPLAALSPKLADMAETTAARRLSFLAEKLPKRPGMGMQVGPDTWQPSDFQMSQFARYVSATEDPDAIIERMNDGSLTTEDVEALREVYPEIYAGIVEELQQQLPTLRQNLPYEKRLMLSIMFGVPVDPAMEPSTLQLLQGNFANEPNTEGGMTAAKPQPAFGSVSKPEPTQAQERSA